MSGLSFYDGVRFVHLLAVVFMAAPLYNLIVVNERARLGKAHLEVDRYLENIIRSNSIRCYVFQLTALVTGLLLAVRAGSLAALVTNPVLAAKEVILLALVTSLSVVHFSIQPRIDRLLGAASGDVMSEAVAAAVGPLRRRRKQMAAVCLVLVIAAVLLGLQVYSRFALATTTVLIALAAVFAWRVYRTPIPYGWV